MVKRSVFLILALTLVFVFALGTVAMAVPSGGANDNPLGKYRSDTVPGYEKPQPFGEAQSAWVHEINAGGQAWTN